MIIPLSNSVECGRLLIILHSITKQYKRLSSRITKFNELVLFFLEDYTILQIKRSVDKEYRETYDIIHLYEMDYMYEYRKTLNAFTRFLLETYSAEFPEIVI